MKPQTHLSNRSNETPKLQLCPWAWGREGAKETGEGWPGRTLVCLRQESRH